MRFAALSLVVVAVLGCGSAQKSELVVYIWGDYLPDAVVRAFEKERGCTVDVKNFTSTDELRGKLLADEAYDVVWPSDDLLPLLGAAGKVEAIDTSKLSNFRNLGERWRGEKYGVPYFWGTTGLCYNTEKIKEPIDSWAALWDPKHKPMSMLEDARECFAAALRLDGKNGNTTDEAAIAKAKERLIAQKQHLLPYNSQPKGKLIEESVWLCQIFSGDALQAAAGGAKIQYVIPKEGGTIWVDLMAIPKAAKNKALAYAFIDYLLRADVSAKLANEIGYANPNDAAREQTNKDVLANSIAYPPEADLKRCERLTDLGKARRLIEDSWAEVLRK
jgi:spermidine/putrescine-binding protein